MPYLQSGADRPHLAGRGEDPGGQAGGHDVPGHQPGRRPVRHRRQEAGRPGLLPVPRPSTPAYGQDYIDAPMDGFILPAKAKNKDAAKQVLEYIGTGAAEASYLKYDQWDVAVATGAQVPTYNSIQTASVQAMANLQGRRAVRRPGHRAADGDGPGDGDPEVHRQPRRVRHQADAVQPGRVRRSRSLASDANGTPVVTHDVARRAASRRETPANGGRRRRSARRFSRRDILVVVAMLAIPVLADLAFIWGPAWSRSRCRCSSGAASAACTPGAASPAACSRTTAASPACRTTTRRPPTTRRSGPRCSTT